MGDSIKLGVEAAAYVTSFFVPPVRLEFEKVCGRLSRSEGLSGDLCAESLWGRYPF